MSASDQPPAAHIVHRLPGRTRMLVPSRRGDAAFFADTVARLRQVPGVAAVTASPRAASLVLRHDASLDPAAAVAGVMDVTSAPMNAPPRRVRHPVRRVSPLALAAGGIAGLAAAQAVRGRVVGNAAEALWNAYQARRTLGMPRLSRSLVAVGIMQLARGKALGSAVSLVFYALSAWSMARRDAERG